MKKSTFFTKVAIMLLVIFLIPIIGISQTYFTPATNTSHGNWRIYPVTATVTSVDLVAGDEIAVFDGGICVGAGVLTAALDGSYSLAVANNFMAWEKSDTEPGYTGGNNYTWKCYDVSATQEYTGTMTFNTDYTPQNYTGLTFPANMDYKWSWIDLVFTTIAAPTGDFSGTITNSVGDAPITGVSVTATGPSPSVETLVTTTDASGNYSFVGVDVGAYSVAATHANFVTQTKSVTVADLVPQDLDYSLVYKTGTLSGIVYNQLNNPIVGAHVDIAGFGQGVSNGSGEYEISLLTPGDHTAVASNGAGYGTDTKTVTISPNATTTQNFTVNADAIIQGKVTDGVGNLLGVTVTAVGVTTYTATTDANGDFSITLDPDTYALSYTLTGYHTLTVTDIEATAGAPYIADAELYPFYYSMGDGNPYGDVWTIYLNTIKGDGAASAIKAGDELAIYTTASGDNTAIAPSKSGTITAYADSPGAPGVQTQVTSVAHNMFEDDVIEIYGSGGGEYDGSYEVKDPLPNSFEIVKVFGTDAVVKGNWQDQKITVTSVGHRLTTADNVVITGTLPSYDATYTNITNITDDTYDLDIPFDRTAATDFGTWTKTTTDLVGHYTLEGQVNSAGTAHALKAYADIYGGIGYNETDSYTFKLWVMGGNEIPLLTPASWTTGSGLWVPTGNFPTAFSSPYSMVDLDFDTPDGTVDVDLTKVANGPHSVDSPIELTLAGAGNIFTETLLVGHSSFLWTDMVPAGTYSLTVKGDRFINAAFTNIVVNPGVTTNVDEDILYNLSQSQTIELSSGYNLASKRVYDDTPITMGVLTDAGTDLSGTSKIDFIKNNIGVIRYVKTGFVGPDFNWESTAGYQFKMNGDEEIDIPESTPISFDADITISENSSTMISYLPDYTLSSAVAFDDLINEGHLIYIRDTEGNSIANINGSWVNHIGNCSAGEAFLVKWDSDVLGNYTFNYPAATKSVEITEELEPVHFAFHNGYGNPTNYVYTLYVNGDILEAGDEIAAFDGSNLVGAKVIIDNANEYGNNLVTFAELFDKEGYTPGNKIVLKLWKASEDKEYWLNYNITNTSGSEYSYTGTTYPSGDAKYSQVEITKSPLSIIDNISEYINIYPNPSNGIVNISSPEQIDRILIINIMGQTMMDIQPESGNTELNLQGFNPGVYFVNLVINGHKVTKKLNIQ